MKRNPGAWLWELLLDRAVAVGLLMMMGIAWLCAAGLTLWLVFGVRLFGAPELISLISLLPGAGFLVAALYKAKSGWRRPDMKKGARAEEMIGQAIEYALTKDACAVAHNVKEVARIGDIDHLIATPHRLWVIETKYGYVPKSKFNQTLRKITANVEGVREWAPGTRVIGCLVFANEKKKPKPIFKFGKETIRAFANRRELVHELYRAAHGKVDSPDLAMRVRKLGELKTADSPGPDR